jgi:hypothetical protein
MIQRLIVCSLICGAIGGAQVTSSSVTVTASRTVNLQPDQVVFGVTVTTPLTSSLDDAVNALSGSAITLANFGGVYTTNVYLDDGSNQTVLAWTFSLLAPLSDMKSAQALLSSVAASLAKKNNGISINFGVQGTQVSAQLQQSQTCSVADLISSARSQAQTLANTASMTLGSILAMTNPIYIGSGCALTVKFAAFPY